MPERLISRVANVIRHLSHCLFGVLVAISPSQTVEQHALFGAYAWAAMFIIGGGVGVYGAVRRRWVTERWALIPLMVGWVVYIASLLIAFYFDPRVVTLAVALAFAIIIQSLLARYGELTDIAEASARREHP